MHYASKTASASRGIPAIRLTLRNPSGFSVPAQFLVLIQIRQVAGANLSIVSLQNWPQARFVAAAGNCVAKKILLTFRMPHGFDFATQNLGAREEFLHLIRKPPPLRKTVGFPKTCGNFSTKSRPTTPKVKVVRPEQNRLLLERTSGFTGGGVSQHNAGVRHSIRSDRLTAWSRLGGCEENRGEELASSFSLLPPSH